MRSGETLYYLEMTNPAQVVPSPRAEDLLSLVEVRDIDRVRALTLGIGRPYDWPSSHWNELRWQEYGQREDIRHWVAVLADEEVGLVSLVLRDGEVEIDTFGLLPAATGRGLGGAFLTVTLRLAWSVHGDVRRVILHTSSEDHPNALQNYLRRGFRLYDTRPPTIG